MKSKVINSLVAMAALLFVISMVSCEEQKPPGLDLGGAVAVDSSYTASVESKQDKVIVIEELTGVTCANCPKAARNIKTLSTANPGRVLTAAMHPPSSGFTTPIPNKSKYDFRVSTVDEVITLLGGLTGGLPSGSINRQNKSAGGIFDSDWPAWVSRITPLLSETTPVNIHIETAYTADNNTGEAIIKVAFTENVTDDLYLTAYILENDIKDYQDDSGTKVADYKHSHVFRAAITSVSGTSLNFADKNAGTVLQKRIKFEPTITGDNAWNLDNCTVIAFVHKSGSDQSILHGAEVSLK